MQCSWIGRIILLLVYTAQGNLQFQCDPYQNTSGMFHKTGRDTSKIFRDTQQIPSSQNNLETEQIWKYHVSSFQLGYKASVIKTLCYWGKTNKQTNKKTRTDPQNKIESPELCLHLFDQQRQDYAIWKNSLQLLGLAFPICFNFHFHQCCIWQDPLTVKSYAISYIYHIFFTHSIH